MIFKLPGFMARSPIKAASENDVTQLEDESLDFDDDNLRGETKWKKAGLRFSLFSHCHYGVFAF